MQRAEMEELRQRDANLTALQAIGPRKKPRLEGDTTTTSTVYTTTFPKIITNFDCIHSFLNLDWRHWFRHYR